MGISTISVPEQLYFAFGSNLHLGQMAKRCPESRYIGTAKLPGHAFQINERGFANILPSRDSYVEGLVYLLSSTDEARLDRSEGCPDKYQKHHLPIELYTAAADCVGRSVLELAQRLQSWGVNRTQVEAPSNQVGYHGDLARKAHQQAEQAGRTWFSGSLNPFNLLGSSKEIPIGDRNRLSGQIGTSGNSNVTTKLSPSKARSVATQTINALVYVSKTYIADGQPRNEYIDRMNAGIVDAQKLGISNLYIQKHLRKHIPLRALPKQGKSVTRSLDGKQQRRPLPPAKKGSVDSVGGVVQKTATVRTPTTPVKVAAKRQDSADNSAQRAIRSQNLAMTTAKKTSNPNSGRNSRQLLVGNNPLENRPKTTTTGFVSPTMQKKDDHTVQKSAKVKAHL